ncbi:hypothetical protein TrVGV298_007948 [Trichoderma virens]|nr:hypothetical protein TrVGV298_007948 [Trichoderma virens]
MCSASPRRLCRHSGRTSKAPVDRRLFIKSFIGGWKRLWDGLEPDEFDPEEGSCLLCATDYDMSLKRDNAKKEWTFTLNTYHCLGSYRTPDDELWAYFTSTFPHTSFGFDYSQPLEARANAQLEELKSRHLKLDRGGARRTWQEAT